MTFWVIVFVIALAAVAFIGAPLALGVAADTNTEDDLPPCVDAIDRDLEFGLIDDRAAREARRDARAAASSPLDAEAPAGVARTARIIAYVSLGAAPLAAVLLYLNIGSPQSLGVKAQTAAAADTVASVGGDLPALEARAAAAPGDFDTWMALGDAYASANRANDSVGAFAQAVSVRPADADAHAAHGEALVLQADGAVTGEAREAFNEAIRIAPNDPRARYYLAEGRYQVGALEDAVRGWAALLDDAPAGAPWFGAVAARMNDAAAEGSITLASLGLSDATMRRLAGANEGTGANAAPSSDQATAIAAMPEDDQRQMIEGMVAGLAERLTKEPDNLEGWRMLGRSYRVLGRPEESAKAWRELLQRTDGGSEDWREFSFALIEQRPQGDATVSAELQGALEKLRTFNPDDPLALFNLGYAARNRGDKAQALELWTQLMEKLPPDSRLRSTLERLIKETQTG